MNISKVTTSLAAAAAAAEKAKPERVTSATAALSFNTISIQKRCSVDDSDDTNRKKLKRDIVICTPTGSLPAKQRATTATSAAASSTTAVTGLSTTKKSNDDPQQKTTNILNVNNLNSSFVNRQEAASVADVCWEQRDDQIVVCEMSALKSEETVTNCSSSITNNSQKSTFASFTKKDVASSSASSNCSSASIISIEPSGAVETQSNEEQMLKEELDYMLLHTTAELVPTLHESVTTVTNNNTSSSTISNISSSNLQQKTTPAAQSQATFNMFSSGTTTTSTTAATLLNRVNFHSKLKGQQLMVNAKKLAEVTQSAKVSIGNKTISVPLLKPLQSTQILQTGQLISASGATTAGGATIVESKQLQAAQVTTSTTTGQHQQQQSHLNLTKLLKGTRKNPTAIVSFAGVQIKPANNTKIVTAKVVSKKMSLQQQQQLQLQLQQQQAQPSTGSIVTITSTNANQTFAMLQQQQHNQDKSVDGEQSEQSETTTVAARIINQQQPKTISYTENIQKILLNKSKSLDANETGEFGKINNVVIKPLDKSQLHCASSINIFKQQQPQQPKSATVAAISELSSDSLAKSTTGTTICTRPIISIQKNISLVVSKTTMAHQKPKMITSTSNAALQMHAYSQQQQEPDGSSIGKLQLKMQPHKLNETLSSKSDANDVESKPKLRPTELLLVKQTTVESIKDGSAEQTQLSDDLGNDKRLTTPNRVDDTNNALLKQLLQNSSNSSSNNSNHNLQQISITSAPLSARKVINVRAPSMGLVSSLEAQLARPVIPPVPAPVSSGNSSNSSNTTSNSNNSSSSTSTTITNTATMVVISQTPKVATPTLIEPQKLFELQPEVATTSTVTAITKITTATAATTTAPVTATITSTIATPTQPPQIKQSVQIVSKETSFISTPVAAPAATVAMPTVVSKLPALIVESSLKTEPLPPPPSYESSTASVSNVTISITTKPNKDAKLSKVESVVDDAAAAVKLETEKPKPQLAVAVNCESWKVQEVNTNANALTNEVQKRKFPAQLQQKQQQMHLQHQQQHQLPQTQQQQQLEDKTLSELKSDISLINSNNVGHELLTKPATATVAVVNDKLQLISAMGSAYAKKTATATSVEMVSMQPQQRQQLQQQHLQQQQLQQHQQQQKQQHQLQQQIQQHQIQLQQHQHQQQQHQLQQHQLQLQNQQPSQSISGATVAEPKVTEQRKRRKREAQKPRRSNVNATVAASNSLKEMTGTLPAGAVVQLASSQLSGPLATGVHLNVCNASSIVTPMLKKRVRKFSKVEEDHDAFTEKLMTHIRQMQPLQVLEPLLNRNYLIGSGSSSSNSNNSSTSNTAACGKLKSISRALQLQRQLDDGNDNGVDCDQLLGRFGNMRHPSIKSLYDSERFGGSGEVNNTLDTEISSNSAALSSIQNDFYDQEFSSHIQRNSRERFQRLMNAVRDCNMETTELVESATLQQQQHAITSRLDGPLAWSRLSRYPGLVLLNTNSNQRTAPGRMSPVALAMDASTMGVPVSPILRSCGEELRKAQQLELGVGAVAANSSNSNNNNNNNYQQKNQNVILSLHTSATENIAGVLRDLANLLHLTPAITCKLIDATMSDKADKQSGDSESGQSQNQEQDQSQLLTSVCSQGNLRKILTGQRKLCRCCGSAIAAFGLRVPHQNVPQQETQTPMLAMLKSLLPCKSPPQTHIFFCNRSCFTQYKWRGNDESVVREDATGASTTLPIAGDLPADAYTSNSMTSIVKLEPENVDMDQQAQQQPYQLPQQLLASQSVPINKTQTSLPAQRKSIIKCFSFNCFAPTGMDTVVGRVASKLANDALSSNNTMWNTNHGSAETLTDTRQCVFCNQRGDGQADGPSRLLNFDVDKWVHLNCALWSNDVYETVSGALMNFQAVLQSGLNQTCTACHQLGATIKCFKSRCNSLYHLPCAIKEECVFYKNKSVHCSAHAASSSTGVTDNELSSFVVHRRVFVDRDENRQVATVMHYSELSNLLRVGNMTFLNVGQLLPHQLEAFHTPHYIYPIGYTVSRYYWCVRRPNRRCRYVCSISEVGCRPEFRIQVHDGNDKEPDREFRDNTPSAVWQQILQPIQRMRKVHKWLQLFPQHISGEDLFGLTEPAIVRILESLPGIETLTDYRFKYGRNPLLEFPLAINPSGAARTEPKQRQLLVWRKPHTQRTAGSCSTQRMANSAAIAGEVACPYSKQFVHSKSSQYKKMKQEWRNNVYLARSKIQGLGLYAARDIEKHTMIIEYIGEVIRTEVSEIREKQYESKNRGIYMFRLDEDRVVDATLSGGLARYINHSCNPNCVTEIVEVDRDVRIIIFAKRKIYRGEELSYDYKFDIEDESHKIPCACGAPNCRKWMN